jgi:transposase
MGAVVIQKQPKFHFRFVPVFNSHTYLGFLKQLVRQYMGRKIHLIADNAKWHKSPEILEWVQANEERIELHFLPKYSPDLNAAEYLWKETRRWATHNRFFPNEAILREKLFRRFNRFQGNPASLRSLIAPFM